MTIAEKGIMKTTDDSNTIVLILENGWNYEESNSNSRSGVSQVHPMQRIYYESQIMHFDISGFQMSRTDEGLFPTNHTMLNINQLNLAIDSLRTRLELRFDDFMTASKSSYTALHSPQIMAIDTAIAVATTDSVEIVAAEDSATAVTLDSAIVATGLDSAIVATRLDSAAVVAKDSILPAIIAKHVLNDVPNDEKQKIVAMALRNARNTKQSIEFYANDLKDQMKTLRKHEVIRQEKFTLSFACLVLFFIGAPLGSIIRKGGMGFPLIVATFLFIIYYVITMLGKKYAVAGELPIWFGAWLSTIVLFPFGLFLTSKANNDSPLFDFDSWKKISYHFFHKKKQHENTVTMQ
jgi:lipopolysaccharide export system permease protein